MTLWSFKLLLLLLVVAATSSIFMTSVASTSASSALKKTTLIVGYLTAIKGELKDKQGLAISGALTMALDEVFVILFCDCNKRGSFVIYFSHSRFQF